MFSYLYRLVTTTLDPSNVTVVTVIGKYIKPSRVVHSFLSFVSQDSPLTYRLADQVSEGVVKEIMIQRILPVINHSLR